MNKNDKKQIVDACTEWLETPGGKNALDRMKYVNAADASIAMARSRALLLDAFFTGASAMWERAENTEAELERAKACMRETGFKTIRLEMPNTENGNAFILTFPNGKEEEALDSLRGVIGSMSELLYAKIPQIETERDHYKRLAEVHRAGCECGDDDACKFAKERDALKVLFESAQNGVTTTQNGITIGPATTAKGNCPRFVDEIVKERDDLRARVLELEEHCAEISEELGLPPTVGPAKGTIKKLVEAAERVRDLEEHLGFIALQNCTRFKDRNCMETSDCVTEYCYPCYAKAVLQTTTAAPGEGE